MYYSSCRSVIDFEEMAAGLNKRRMIQSAVYKELVKVLLVQFCRITKNSGFCFISIIRDETFLLKSGFPTFEAENWVLGFVHAVATCTHLLITIQKWDTGFPA
jgi:hypothetical protein